MKLRIKDNSLRFRLLRSEVSALAENGRIEAYTFFSPMESANRFCYAVEHSEQISDVGAMRSDSGIRVVVPSASVLDWAHGDRIGIYGEQAAPDGQVLIIALEKDFACIDGSDADNTDTFENPNPSSC